MNWLKTDQISTNKKWIIAPKISQKSTKKWSNLGSIIGWKLNKIWATNSRKLHHQPVKNQPKLNKSQKPNWLKANQNQPKDDPIPKALWPKSILKTNQNLTNSQKLPRKPVKNPPKNYSISEAQLAENSNK